MAILVTFPPTTKLHRLQIGSQHNSFSGPIKDLTTPASGVSAAVRLANWRPAQFRLHVGTDGGGIGNVILPFHASYTASAVTVDPWVFSRLNNHMRDAYANCKTVVLNPRYGPDNLWTGSAGMGGGSGTGVYTDRSFQTLADWYAQVLRYYNKPDDGSGLRPVGWTSGLGGSTDPTPWPPKDTSNVSIPIAVANGGPGIRILEILNEVDYHAENPRASRPALSAPTLTLTKVSGGTLTAATYNYQAVGYESNSEPKLQSVSTPITLDAADIAGNLRTVRVTVNPVASTGNVPHGYWIKGRSTLNKMAFVGRDAPGGIFLDDDGSITPSGAQAAGSGAESYVVSPREYTQVWDKVWANIVAMGLDRGPNSVELMGPSLTNPISIGGTEASVIETVRGTGPSDNSWLDSRGYLQSVAESTHRPDYFTYHAYGSFTPGDTDATIMAHIADILTDIGTSVDPFIAGTLISHTEGAVQATDGSDTRACRAFGMAWLGSIFARLCARTKGPQWAVFNQFTYVQSHTFGMLAVGDDGAYLADGNPYLTYWTAFHIDAAMPVGSLVCTTSGAPANVDAYAVAQTPEFTKVRVLVVNRTAPAGNVNVDVTMSGGTVVASRHRIMDSTTSLTGTDVGTPTSDGAAGTVNLQLNGYSIAIVEFDMLATGSQLRVQPPAGRPVFF